MLGAIAGDVIGSVYEFNSIKHVDFPLFSEKCYATDDSLLTIAVADHLLHGHDLVDLFHGMVKENLTVGWGSRFLGWGYHGEREPYNSWGNGSAMRVSPVGFAASSLEEALHLARRVSVVTHNHPEGIKGAQSTAAAIFLARNGKSKEEIRAYIETAFDYDLSRTLADIRPDYGFDVSCQGSVPESIISFLESTSFEGAIRNAISLGGDADTMACIAGGIAQAFYGEVPAEIRDPVLARLEPKHRTVVREFCTRYDLGTV